MSRSFASTCVLAISVSIILLVGQLSTNVVAQSKSPLTHCRSTLFRLIGSTNAFLWVCRCIRDGNNVALGRASYTVPPKLATSVRKHKAFVRCQNHNRQHLKHICDDQPERYEEEAKKAMHECGSAPFRNNAATRCISSPFVFQRSKCFAEFVSLSSSTQTTGMWACLCKQRHVEIVSGRAQFASEGAPSGSAKEIAQLFSCSKPSLKSFQDICVNAPGDFQLLALHRLQACCKRARVATDAKLGCEAFVPKDVDALKATFAN